MEKDRAEACGSGSCVMPRAGRSPSWPSTWRLGGLEEEWGGQTGLNSVLPSLPPLREPLSFSRPRQSTLLPYPASLPAADVF